MQNQVNTFKQKQTKIAQSRPCKMRSIYSNKGLLRVNHTEPGQYVQTKYDYPESAMRNQVNMFKQRKIAQSRPCRTRSICSNKRRLYRVGRTESGQYVQIKEAYSEAAMRSQVNLCSNKRRLPRVGRAEQGQYVQIKEDYPESAVQNQVNTFKQKQTKIAQSRPCKMRSIYSNKIRLPRVSHEEPGQYVQTKEDCPESAVQNQVNMFKQKKIIQSRPYRTRSICSNKRSLLRGSHAESGQYVQIKEAYSEAAMRSQVNLCSNKRRLPRVGRAEQGQYVQTKEDCPEPGVQNQVKFWIIIFDPGW